MCRASCASTPSRAEPHPVQGSGLGWAGSGGPIRPSGHDPARRGGQRLLAAGKQSSRSANRSPRSPAAAPPAMAPTPGGRAPSQPKPRAPSGANEVVDLRHPGDVDLVEYRRRPGDGLEAEGDAGAAVGPRKGCGPTPEDSAAVAPTRPERAAGRAGGGRRPVEPRRAHPRRSGRIHVDANRLEVGRRKTGRSMTVGPCRPRGTELRRPPSRARRAGPDPRTG